MKSTTSIKPDDRFARIAKDYFKKNLRSRRRKEQRAKAILG